MDARLFLVPLVAVLFTGCAGLQQEHSNTSCNTPWPENLTPVQEPLTTVGRNEYFVLEPGYRLLLAGEEAGRKIELTITVLDEIQPVGGQDTRVVEEREAVNGQLAEVSRNYLALGTETKNLYYFGEDVDVFRDGKINHEGAWRADRGNAKHGILVPGTIKLGDRYYQEQAPKLAMDRAENVATNASVATPAGIFENCLKVKESTPLEPGSLEYKYYAPGVGLVQDGNLRLIKRAQP